MSSASRGPSSPISARKALTTAGSNCVPAQLDSSSRAPGAVRGSPYGRLDVIAWNASQTKTIRLASGISSRLKPSG